LSSGVSGSITTLSPSFGTESSVGIVVSLAETAESGLRTADVPAQATPTTTVDRANAKIEMPTMLDEIRFIPSPYAMGGPK
jgi:hypothetical protein